MFDEIFISLKNDDHISKNLIFGSRCILQPSNLAIKVR